VIDQDDAPSARCCPDAERIHGLRTVDGEAAFDVHEHKGLLRGFIALPDRHRLMHWLRNGRLTRARETGCDLRRTAR